MVMISSIEEVAQVVLQVHHQHRLRGWTLSAELGDSLLLGGGAALELRLARNMRRDGARVPGTSDVGVVSQHRALACPRAHSPQSERFVRILHQLRLEGYLALCVQNEQLAARTVARHR